MRTVIVKDTTTEGVIVEDQISKSVMTLNINTTETITPDEAYLYIRTTEEKDILTKSVTVIAVDRNGVVYYQDNTTKEVFSEEPTENNISPTLGDRHTVSEIPTPTHSKQTPEYSSGCLHSGREY